ncbi:MAG TPA: serine/threonine-protein kinase [Ktedonobacteraceae bacterium]|nr:serine/threonine-protein kinase [Ktedonobacteraceae bacterium]
MPGKGMEMPERVGQQLGNYQLVKLLGHGGFADVYLGEHVYLKTQAAIKVLKMEVDNEQRNNFLNEARTIAHLIHPHIIRVLDFGVEGYTPFLVMDYAPNGTLRERHPSGTRLPLATILIYVKQVASALQYAHDQHFVHRDVKPGNMLIGAHDEILLSDFGIALVAQNSSSQDTQDTVGTAAYMAPEQIEGKPRPASDQYALGITVYEWLCGERPFNGSLTEVVTQQLSTPPPSLRAKVPEISPDLEEAVMMALAKNPHDRFATVEAFANALEQSTQARKYPERVLRPVSPPQPQAYSTQPAMFLPSPGPTRTSPAPQQWQSSMASQQQANNHVVRKSKPASELPHSKLVPSGDLQGTTRKSSVSRQIAGMVIGLVLYGCAYTFIGTLAGHNNELAGYALFSLTVVIPIFFGVVFGPLVGLVSGGGGYLMGHYLSGNPAYWNNGLGIALTGLIAGLAMLRTGGYYGKFRAIATAILFSIFGIIVGEGIVDCGSIWVSNANMKSAAINFVIFTLLELVCSLILLPILLAIYNLLTRGSRRA